MFLDERLDRIMEMLREEGKVIVKELAETFQVSEGMIRKDLQKLEREGKLKRTYGGAILNRQLVSASELKERLINRSAQKERVAQKAYDLIEDGETVFLDISSINYMIAEKLSKSQKKVTVITNMSVIPPLFPAESKCEILSIGGVYNKELGGVIGSGAVAEILKYRVAKCFLGSCGVSLDFMGVTNFNIEEGNTKSAILSIAKKSFLVMENKKFNVEGVYRFSSLEEVDAIITEGAPEKHILKELEKIKMEVI